ncbi:MAG TPA: tRNA (adenosine(37)-N6)-threonylcarbamoyltransferase complex dimerization subunit type 1 TsaB [Polyangiaceae bacterium]
MLVLALETSSQRGSVALVEDGRLMAHACHDEPNAHGERLLGLMERVLHVAGRSMRTIDRIAVGRGPGAFTGLRVGLALAQGIGAGLGIPAIGIGSLRAMAAAVPDQIDGDRWPIMDARRDEVFVACFRPDGTELLAPHSLPRSGALQSLRQLAESISPGTGTPRLLGAALDKFTELIAQGSPFVAYRGEGSDWPGAIAVGRIACDPNELAPASPDYLRGADAILPKLPPCPLDLPLEHR